MAKRFVAWAMPGLIFTVTFAFSACSGTEPSGAGNVNCAPAGGSGGNGGGVDTTGATTSEETAFGSDSSTGYDYGLCGWNPDKNYYACMSDGGISGMIDRDHPIDCPPDVMKGDPCTEGGDVNNYGCSTPEGVLYYCEITETNKVIEVDCSM